MRFFYILKAIYWIAIGAMGSYWVLYFLSKDFSLAQVSVILLMLPIATVIFEIPTGAIADIYGNKISVFLSYLLTSMAFAWVVLAGNNYYLVLVAYFIAGAAFTLESGAIDAWFVDTAKHKGHEEKLDEYFSKWSGLAQIGFIVGPLIGALLVKQDISYAFVFTALSMFVLSLYTLLGKDYKKPKVSLEKETKSLKLHFITVLNQTKNGIVLTLQNRNLMILTLVTILLSVLYTVIYNGYQPLIEQKQIPIEYLGYALSIAGIISVPALYLNHKLKKFLGSDKNLLVVATVLTGLATILFTTATAATIVFIGLIGYTLFSEFAREFSPSYRNLINKNIEDENRATLLSVNSTGIRLGEFIGLPLLGILGSSLGLNTLILVGGILVTIVGFGYLLVSKN